MNTGSQNKNRLRFLANQIPGTARFSIKAIELNSSSKKKRKSKKEKRRIRNLFKKQFEESSEAEEEKKSDDSTSVRPSYKLSAPSSGSRR